MPFNRKFEEVCSFLAPWEGIWNREIIIDFPEPLASYPQNWLSELDNLEEEDLFLFDSNHPVEDLKTKAPALAFLLDEINELTRLEKFQDNSHGISNIQSFHLKEKKKHEIETIVSVVGKLQKSHHLDSLVDIGGGQGHLSRIISHELGVPSWCVDADESLLQAGQKRIAKLKYYPRKAEVTFVNHRLDHNGLSEGILPGMKGSALSLGLHTCGPLALHHLSLLNDKHFSGVLNFPCCYLKCDPEKDTHLSQISRELPFRVSKYGLTLATRSHAKTNRKMYEFKKRVKQYRYALHLFLLQHDPRSEFLKAGSSHKRVYEGNFSSYAMEKLAQWGYEGFKEIELEEFFNSETTRKLLDDLFKMNSIRWKFGRMVEMFLLLDRCLWLEEQGHHVSLAEYFNPDLSPRNIGMTVIKSPGKSGATSNF